MKRKCKNRRGESFIETIAAMLIISFGMLMLAGAIVASARVNNRASSSNILVVPPDPGNTDTPTTSQSHLSGKISVSNDPGNTDNYDTFSITVYTVTPEGGGSGDGQILRYYIAS